jgi:hypothetical protein
MVLRAGALSSKDFVAKENVSLVTFHSPVDMATFDLMSPKSAKSPPV